VANPREGNPNRVPRVGFVAKLAVVSCLCAAGPAAAAAPLSDPNAPVRGGRTLVSDTGGWVCVGGCSYTYAWQRCTATCSTVPGRTGATYLLTTPDIGARVRSVVTAADGVGSASRASAQTAPVASAPPVNTTPPFAVGSPRVGSTLSSTPGSWDDPSPASVIYTRRWARCTTAAPVSCTPVSSAPTYVPGAGDVGRYIRRMETAEGLGAATVFSIPLGAIASPPATPSGTPFSSGGSADPPASRTGAPRLRPFPVVVVAGRLRRGRTIVREFIVRGPRRARVRLRCRGRGCPFGRISRTIGRRKRMRIRRAERSYRAGIVLEVRVTGRDRVGKFTRLRFRTRGVPSRSDLCLQPGARRPSRCPS
jgi:hypothetical protein